MMKCNSSNHLQNYQAILYYYIPFNILKNFYNNRKKKKRGS